MDLSNTVNPLLLDDLFMDDIEEKQNDFELFPEVNILNPEPESKDLHKPKRAALLPMIDVIQEEDDTQSIASLKRQKIKKKNKLNLKKIVSNPYQ